MSAKAQAMLGPLVLFLAQWPELFLVSFDSDPTVSLATSPKQAASALHHSETASDTSPLAGDGTSSTVASTDCSPLERDRHDRPVPSIAMKVLTEADSETRLCRAWWTVPAKTLTSSNRVMVSHGFEVPNVPGTFKMLLWPVPVSDGKGGSCFRRAKGRCFLELKCDEAAVGSTNFAFYLGSKGSEMLWHGPVEHDFSMAPVFSMAVDQAKDCKAVVDEETGAFTVCLEFSPRCCATSKVVDTVKLAAALEGRHKGNKIAA